MKNERVSQAEKYFREKFRSLAGKIRRLGAQKQRTSDFGPGSGSETVMLRERTWRIEVNRTKAKRFLRRHKIAIVATLAVVFVGVTTRYVLIGFASTVDFYPSSCLGNWENVQNALGKPSLTPDAPAYAFTGLNSAIFGTSTAQMFCGNFSGDTDIDTLMGKSFQSADLVLSWSLTFPQAAPVVTPSVSNQSSDGGGGGGSGGGTTVSPPPSSPDSSVSAPDDTSSTDSTDISSTDASSTPSDGSSMPNAGTDTDSVSSTPNDASSTDDATLDASSTNSSGPAASSSDDTTQVTPTSTDGTDSSSSDNPAPLPPATTTPTPPDTNSDSGNSTAPASDPTDSNSSPTSWLRKLVGVAYADQTSSIAAAASTTELADSSTAPMDASSAQEAVPATPQPTPININTSMFQNIILPSSTANEVLAIVYSTDGVTWQPLVNIDSSNWQQKRYPIPINSWTELQHLQIAFVGLGASSSPQIYLDSAGVEVSYVDTPETTIDITSSTDQTDNTDATDTIPSAIPPEDIIQRPVISQSDIFEQGAHQQCVVAPFSQAVAAGRSVNYSLELFSGLTTPSTPTSTQNPTSTAPIIYQQPVYQTQVGSLPVGISAEITSGKASAASSTQSIHVSASAQASPGSYSVLIIYRERQNDASMRSTGCQMNIVVD